jgi:hypothetical protein
VRALHRYLWAAPTSIIGLVFAALACWRGRVRVVDGVLEAHGPALRWVLSRLVPIAGGAAAMTFGHVVIARDASSLESSRAHERVHVQQYERWGILFIPAYLAASLRALVRGRDPYYGNWFEREACRLSGAVNQVKRVTADGAAQSYRGTGETA